jgi:hypothetical protein
MNIALVPRRGWDHDKDENILKKGLDKKSSL